MRIPIPRVASCALLLIAALWLAPRAALADVVPPPPDDCPEGTTPRTGHSGPYCQPPAPTDCKPGYEPRVYLAEAYCEPPPPQPCPEGSYWTSHSATSTWCQGGRSCEGDYPCGEGTTCKETSLCVREQRQRRFVYEVVSGTCVKDEDCVEGQTCVTAKRCDPDVKRAPVEGHEPPPQDADEEPTAAPEGKQPVVGDGVDVGGEAAAGDEADTDEVEPKGCSVAEGTASTVMALLIGLGLLVITRRRG